MSTRLISGGVDWILREGGYSTIAAACLDPDCQVVRFLVSNGPQHLVLCWHVQFELWTTADPPLAGAIGRINVPSGIVNAFRLNWMALNDTAESDSDPSCQICREYSLPESLDEGSHLDGSPGAGRWYQLHIETANIKTDGLLGFQRIWRAEVLTKSNSPETGIELSYAIDYSDDASGDPRQWLSGSEIFGGATNNPNQWRYSIHIDKQQCSAIRLICKDLQRDGLTTVESRLTFVGFGIEWGQEPGTGRGHWKGKK